MSISVTKDEKNIQKILHKMTTFFLCNVTIDRWRYIFFEWIGQNADINKQKGDKKMNAKRIVKWLMTCTMIILLVSVASAAETTKVDEISSFNNYGENGVYTSMGEYEVAYGSTVADVTHKLPSTLTATLTTGEEVEVPVTWVCVSDNLGGNTYVPKHTDASAVYTFEAQLGDGYKLAGNLPEDYVMPFVTVGYTEGAQELNSQAPDLDTEVDMIMEEAAGMSVWSWIIWIIVIVILVVILWWLFAGSKNNKEQ